MPVLLFTDTNKFIPSKWQCGIGTTSPGGLLHIKNLSGIDYIQITKNDTSNNLDIVSAYNGSDDGQSGSFGYGVRALDDAWQIWEKPKWCRGVFITAISGGSGGGGGGASAAGVAAGGGGGGEDRIFWINCILRP